MSLVVFLAVVATFWPHRSVAVAEPVLTDPRTAEYASMPALSIISEDFSGPLRWMADDLASMFKRNGTLSVLPVFGVGGHDAASDVFYLKAIDVALVHSDLLAFMKRHDLDRNVDSRLRYIAQLYAKQVYIVAGPQISTVEDLAGRKVSFDHSSSSNALTTASIFEMLGVQVEQVRVTNAQALDMVRSGDIAAAVLIDDAPNALLATLRREGGLHLVPLEPTDELREVYTPTAVTSDDYPNLIAGGETVSSISVSVVMAMYNWPPDNGRYDRVARFVDQFFSRIQELQEGERYPKWQRVDIAASLPGWVRFKPAEDWLRRDNAPQGADGNALSTLRVVFRQFLESQFSGEEVPDEEQEKELFREFLAWADNPDEAQIEIHLTSPDGVGNRIGVIRARNTQISIGAQPDVGLVLRPEISGLPPGVHAIRFHANANCGPGNTNGAPVRGLGAGRALRIANEVPDMRVAANGTANETILVPQLNLSDLLERSIVIYGNDNPRSARVACGTIK